MKTMVIAEFPAMGGKLEELEALLRSALPDTRAFAGCISIETYLHLETETFTLIEFWGTPEHYQRYLDWRMETGLGDVIDNLLDGGMTAFKPRTFVATGI